MLESKNFPFKAVGIQIGDFLITQPVGGNQDKIGLFVNGEGGDFDKAGLVAAIEKFYKDNL